MRLRRRRAPTVAEIRAGQLRDVARVLGEVAAGQSQVLVEGRWISAEAAWAAATSILKAFELGGRYDGQEREPESGVWLARVELADGLTVRVGIGRFDASTTAPPTP